MDSRSLERVGVYISRCDATRSFVNQSSTSQDTCSQSRLLHLYSIASSYYSVCSENPLYKYPWNVDIRKFCMHMVTVIYIQVCKIKAALVSGIEELHCII